MTITALKLVNGEELVVEIVETNDAGVTFKNPVAVVLQRGQQGPILGFIPWMQSSNGPFTVLNTHIVTRAEVADEVKNGYNQIFGAGIVVPPQQLITG